MSALGSLVVKLALEYAEYTKGLSKADQESLKFAQNVQKHMDTAKSATNDFFAGIVKGAVGAAAAYVSVQAVLDKLNGSVDTLAKLDDMSQKTGAAVENLSKMQKVASAFGTDFNNVDSALTKLAKGMAGTDEESSKVAKVLASLGVQAKDTADKLRDPSEVMTDVAKKFQNYKDGANKAALATELFGKSGADLLPYLNDLAESVDKFSGSSAEAAKQAADFQDRLGLMRVKSEELYTAIAVDLLPTFNDFIDALNDTRKEGDKLFGDKQITNWADDVAVGIARVIDVAKLVPQTFRAIGGSFESVFADMKLAKAVGEAANPIGVLKSLVAGESPSAAIKAAFDSRMSPLRKAAARWRSRRSYLAKIPTRGRLRSSQFGHRQKRKS